MWKDKFVFSRGVWMQMNRSPRSVVSYVAAATALAVWCASGCGYRTAQGKTKVLDASARDTLGGAGTSSADIRAMADLMARKLAGLPLPQEGPTPRVHVIVRNNTRFRVDPALLRNKLVKELVNKSQGKFQFLARDSEEEVLAERAKKRAGLYDAGKLEQTLLGADYLFKVDMRALSKAAREGVSDYIVYSFTLVDAETTQILWMDDYETKKQSSVGVMYQ
ncbi:MAG: hypothetical protein AAF471_00820 [Myxococcota bacterium]